MVAGTALAGYKIIGTSGAQIAGDGGGSGKGRCVIAGPTAIKRNQNATYTITVKNDGKTSFMPAVGRTLKNTSGGTVDKSNRLLTPGRTWTTKFTFTAAFKQGSTQTVVGSSASPSFTCTKMFTVQ